MVLTLFIICPGCETLLHNSSDLSSLNLSVIAEAAMTRSEMRLFISTTDHQEVGAFLLAGCSRILTTNNFPLIVHLMPALQISVVKFHLLLADASPSAGTPALLVDHVDLMHLRQYPYSSSSPTLMRPGMVPGMVPPHESTTFARGRDCRCLPCLRR